MEFTFDGHGVNDKGAEYCPRVATITDHGHDIKAGALLAAAPDLLAALELSIFTLSSALGEDDEVVRDGRAAIAKAKGVSA